VSGPFELKAVRAPLAPKFHGAWLGAGTGIGLGQVINALLIWAVWHGGAEPDAVANAVTYLAGIAVAALGAYLAPHQPRPQDAALAVAQEAEGQREAEEFIRSQVRVRPPGSGTDLPPVG
jgi:hypothetical protein